MDWDIILGILGTLIGIGTPLVGAGIARRNRYVYSWKRIRQAVHQLHEQIALRGLEPDVIVAFAKGGLIVADLLNHEFHNRFPICTFCTRRLSEGRERLVEIDDSYINLQNFVGKKLLLVDDVMQSGSTLIQVEHLLVEKYGIEKGNIFVAVLSVPKAVTSYKPDFHVFEFEYGEKRPVLPWGTVPRD